MRHGRARREIRAGALDHETLTRFTKEWRATLHEHRYLALGWPAEYGGGGLSELEQVVVAEEFARAGVPAGGPNDGFGITMLGNTLLQWGTDEQKQHYLPRILSGEDLWCRGYSSRTRGPTSARSSAGLCSTGSVGDQRPEDLDVLRPPGRPHLPPRPHRPGRQAQGDQLLLVAMDQPGVEVRPIKMISGDSEFNEVFFTDATCPRARSSAG